MGDEDITSEKRRPTTPQDAKNGPAECYRTLARMTPEMSNRIPQYTKVKITTDRFAGEGVPAGTVGWIIEIHQDASGPAYEVEVMDDEGHTLALVVPRPGELEPVQEGQT